MTIEEAAADYLSYLRHERMSAKTTLYTYSSWLNSFRKWLTESGSPEADLSLLTTPTLRSYQYALSARKLRPRTIRAAFHPLRGLAAFLLTHKAIPSNPCAGLTMPKKDAAIRLTISQAEVIALISNTHRLHPPRKAALARAMLSVMVFTGLRFREVLDLKVSSVNTDAKTLLVASGKGDKSRLLYPPAECFEALCGWLDVRDKTCQRKTVFSHEWLWAYNAGRRVGENSFRDLLEEVKAAAGLTAQENIKPHSLRHFFATNLDQNGAPLKVIQAALGHSSAQTTLIYLHSTEKDAQRMADFSRLSQMQEPHPAQAKPQEPERRLRRQSFQQSKRGR